MASIGVTRAWADVTFQAFPVHLSLQSEHSHAKPTLNRMVPHTLHGKEWGHTQQNEGWEAATMASSVQYAPMHAWRRMGDEAQSEGGKVTISVRLKPGSLLTSHPFILKCGHE